MSYPRPQFKREAWTSLDGGWAFSFSPVRLQNEVEWTHEITVPYPPESKLSGVHDEAFHPVAWYQRTFTVPAEWAGRRVRLHFGAVDYRAQVWVNGHLVATHEGGHTPFWADVTHALSGGDDDAVAAGVGGDGELSLVYERGGPAGGRGTLRGGGVGGQRVGQGLPDGVT